MDRNTAPAARQRRAEVEIMETPEDVVAMVRPTRPAGADGGSRRSSGAPTRRSVGTCGRLAACGTAGRRALDGLEDWLKAQFLQHRGNTDVVR